VVRRCIFLRSLGIQSHDEKEIVEIAVQHAKKSHNMKITEKEVREMMKDTA
jgi:predicted small metal-binding protein